MTRFNVNRSYHSITKGISARNGINANAESSFWTQPGVRAVALDIPNRSDAQHTPVHTSEFSRPPTHILRPTLNRAAVYRSSRKDSVKQHIKRRHGPSATRLEIRTLPIGAPAPGSSSAPAPSESDTELSASYSPPPSLHMAEVPYLLHPPLESSVQPGQLGLYSLPPPPAPSAMYYDGHIPQYMSAYHAESA